jgi:uncharacterized membrane protein YfcA
VTPVRFGIGVVVGFVSGVLSGTFGVGGAVVTTPAVNVLLGGTAIQAVATPLPVVFPSSLVGAVSYARANEVSFRALRYAAIPGIVGAVVGAALTEVIDPHLLLIVTAALIGWTGVGVARGTEPSTPWVRGRTPAWKYAAIGLLAGLVSGLLGVGGGIVMVPAFTLWIGMPLRRALGTSLVVISVIAIPGTIVHWALGHIDWAIFASLALGVIPGARVGSAIALAASERALRLAVGVFLVAIAILYGIEELTGLLTSRA